MNRPVASYGFEEPNGAIALDGSGHGNAGVLTGKVTRTVDGIRGKVLSFAGTNGLVTVADAPSLDLTNAFTLEAWVKPAALSGWRTVLLKETRDGLSYALYAADNAPPWAAGYANIGAADESIRSNKGLPVGVWTHLAVTYDGTELRLFENGVETARRL